MKFKLDEKLKRYMQESHQNILIMPQMCHT